MEQGRMKRVRIQGVRMRRTHVVAPILSWHCHYHSKHKLAVNQIVNGFGAAACKHAELQ